MPDLKETFKTLEAKSPRGTCNIAGYMDGTTFIYHISSNENLPAAATVFDVIGKRAGTVYTNLEDGHWLYTFTTGDDSKDGKLVHIDDSNSTVEKTDTIRGVGKGKIRILAGEGADPGPLGDAGGLYDVAKTLYASKTPVTYTGNKTDHTRTRGLHRALRYYMLAAYALLGKCAQGGYAGGNYIAAMLVDDEGKIVSYGVNSGWYRHGETNMLLNYFRGHSSAGKFPSNTIVFSTLTPCKQCSDYLESTRPADSVIFMGQEDTGSLGKVGAEYGKYLNAVTDPLKNRVMKPVFQKQVIGQKTVKGAWGKPDTTVPVYGDVQTGVAPEKYLVETFLANKMGQGASVAAQVGQKCSEILIQSRQTFDHKSSKVRDDAHEDELVKHQVLEYLNGWIAAVPSKSDLKQIA